MEVIFIKRLLWYLNQISDNATTTFRYTTSQDGAIVQKELYDGECAVIYTKPSGEVINPERYGVRRDPVFWYGELSFAFARTHRMALDRPTVTVGIPVKMLGLKEFTNASADFCLRELAAYFDEVNAEYENKSRADVNNGKFYIYRPGQEVVVRNAAYFAFLPTREYEYKGKNILVIKKFAESLCDIMCLCIRIEVQLPVGNLKRTKKMLTVDMPKAIERFVSDFNNDKLNEVLDLEKTQNSIRAFLKSSEYCVFIANGSILARESGGLLPLKDSVPFVSPSSDELLIENICGMGIRRGVTVITGGGYSGKSTILNAISAGVYNHCIGDGRELCITDESAVTITAEDGRSISSVNISPFVKWIPGSDPREFSTPYASGSTSEAANIVEALESGSRLLLIDEDRSATNFMIRDSLMKEFIKREPLTPFTDRVGELAENGISTILVIGGSGEYFSVADSVYLMEDYSIYNATQKAKEHALKKNDIPNTADWKPVRIMTNSGFTTYPQGSGSERLSVSSIGYLMLGDEIIDVRSLHDITSLSMVRAVAYMLRWIMKKSRNQDDEIETLALSIRGLSAKNALKPIHASEIIDSLYEHIETETLQIIDTDFFCESYRFFELPRKFELFSVINRMRGVKWTTKTENNK